MIALNERTSDEDLEQLDQISRLALELGVRLREDAPREGPAATAIWLFDGSVETLPGGFDVSEISPNSPVKVLKTFPQELTLVGRSTVLIKGIAARLGVKWSLADEWAPIARRLLERQSSANERRLGAPPKLRSVGRLLSAWAAGKGSAIVQALPTPVRRPLAAVAVRVTKFREARRERKARARGSSRGQQP